MGRQGTNDSLDVDFEATSNTYMQIWNVQIDKFLHEH